MEIPHKSEPALPLGSLGRLIPKEQLKVCVYTTTFMLSGYIHCLQRQRLLDLLNSIVVGELRLGNDFLPITEVASHNQDGTETTMQFVLINKKNILFVSEIEQQEDSGIDESHKFPPTREKLLITAKFYIPPYTLSGQIHCAKGQRLSDLLNTKDRFIPMTNVNITQPSGIVQPSVFIAVNKKQIIYAEEISP